MTPEQGRSLGLYVLWAFVGAVVATGLQLAAMLSGTDVIAIRPLAAVFTSSFFGSLATVVGTSQLTRFGSEGIARQVDALKAQGVPKAEMIVLPQDEAATVIGRHDPGAPFSAEQVDQIATRLLELRAEFEGRH